MHKFIKSVIDKQIENHSLIGLVLEKIIFDKYNYKEKRRYRKKILNNYINKLRDVEVCLVLARQVGFLSLFLQVIEQLNLCEKYGIKVVVFFNKNCLYWDKKLLSKSGDVWEYFFKPTSNEKLKNLIKGNLLDLNTATYNDFEKHVKNNTIVSDLYLHNIIPEFGINEQKRVRIHDLISKYIIIDNEVFDEVEEFAYKYFLGKNIIGVHLRGKERYYDLHIAGYGFLGINYYIKEIDKCLKRDSESKIFLASDNEIAVHKMEEIYGEKIILTKSIRSSDDLGRIHLSMGNLDLAKEALIDCLLLSKCNFFIHGFSNIASAACYFNDKLDHINVYDKYKWNSLFEWFTGKERPGVD